MIEARFPTGPDLPRTNARLVLSTAVGTTSYLLETPRGADRRRVRMWLCEWLRDRIAEMSLADRGQEVDYVVVAFDVTIAAAEGGSQFELVVQGFAFGVANVEADWPNDYLPLLLEIAIAELTDQQ